MNDVKGTPFDYSDERIPVYFEVADKQSTRSVLKNTPYINDIKIVAHGFEVNIAIQQIPEIVRDLSQKNIAIYAVIPQK